MRLMKNRFCSDRPFAQDVWLRASEAARTMASTSTVPRKNDRLAFMFALGLPPLLPLTIPFGVLVGILIDAHVHRVAGRAGFRRV